MVVVASVLFKFFIRNAFEENFLFLGMSPQAGVIIQHAFKKKKKVQLNRPLLAMRSSSKRQINQMITTEVFLDTGEVDERPLASCRMDGSIQNSTPLSRRSGTFPGSQNSKPTGEAQSEYDAHGA